MGALAAIIAPARAAKASSASTSGTALYLALCVEGSASLPGFDDNDFV
jgi:hypothetical protein